MSSEVFQVRSLDTAEELFDAISPISDENLLSEANEWIFRGQSNEVDGNIWRLSPSAFRNNAFLKYRIGEIAEIQAPDGQTQLNREMKAALDFIDRVDMEGLIVPGESYELRERRMERSDPDYQEFPPARLIPIFALAQHHGVPTRLLDWTRKPWVAVYFAAERVARRRVLGVELSREEAPFSVYALRRSVFVPANKLDPMIVPVHVSTATNANLHAQGGMFTLVQLKAIDEHPLPDLLAVIERNVETLKKKLEHKLPCLIEYRVPAREARTTLMLLSRLGVNAGSVFPGLGGIAKSMEEPRFYQWAEPGERS